MAETAGSSPFHGSPSSSLNLSLMRSLLQLLLLKSIFYMITIWHSTLCSSSTRLCMIPTECNNLFAYVTVIITFPFTILNVIPNFFHFHKTMRTAVLDFTICVVFYRLEATFYGLPTCTSTT